tara:strand:- start:3 stop:146 length:144 start_codon:yes stop_codon:yes gene_type:complete
MYKNVSPEPHYQEGYCIALYTTESQFDVLTLDHLDAYKFFFATLQEN